MLKYNLILLSVSLLLLFISHKKVKRIETSIRMLTKAIADGATMIAYLELLKEKPKE